MIYKKIIYFLLILLFAMSLFLPERLIKINSIECTSQNGACHKTISEKLREFEKLSLYEAKKNISHYLNREVRVEKYRTQFKLPDKVSIDIVEKTGKYAVTDKSVKEFYLIDEKGDVLEKTETIKLPFLVINEGLPELGNRMDSRKIAALKLVSEISATFGTQSGVLEDDSLVIEVNNGLNVILPVDGDSQLLMGSLILITGQLNDDESENLSKTAFTTLDLRFKDPVLR